MTMVTAVWPRMEADVLRVVIGLLLSVVLATGNAQAQQNEHDGFWIGFGVGGGYDTDANLGGGAGYFRLGGTPTQQVLIGVEGLGWARTQNSVTISRANLTGTLMVYPSRSGNVFLKSGLGFASVTAGQTTGNVTRSVSDQGLGATFGAGYDIKLGRNFYLTPNADVQLQIINHDTRSLLLITLGGTWH